MSVLKKTYIAGIAEDDKEIMTEYKLKIKEGRSLRDSRDRRISRIRSGDL